MYEKIDIRKGEKSLEMLVEGERDLFIYLKTWKENAYQ
jgi:hypothetical protein